MSIIHSTDTHIVAPRKPRKDAAKKVGAPRGQDTGQGDPSQAKPLTAAQLKRVRMALADYDREIVYNANEDREAREFPQFRTPDLCYDARDRLIKLVRKLTGNRPPQYRYELLDPFPLGSILIDGRVCMVSFDVYNSQDVLHVDTPLVGRSS